MAASSTSLVGRDFAESSTQSSPDRRTMTYQWRPRCFTIPHIVEVATFNISPTTRPPTASLVCGSETRTQSMIVRIKSSSRIHKGYANERVAMTSTVLKFDSNWRTHWLSQHCADHFTNNSSRHACTTIPHVNESSSKPIAFERAKVGQIPLPTTWFRASHHV
jgi:hypothetical protein